MRKRDIRVQFRLTPEEAELLDCRVEKSGLSRSCFMRYLINGLIPVDLPPPDYQRFARELHAIGNNLNQIAHKAHALGVVDAKRYEEAARDLDEKTKEIVEAVYSFKEMDRWQPPRSGE